MARQINDIRKTKSRNKNESRIPIPMRFFVGVASSPAENPGERRKGRTGIIIRLTSRAIPRTGTLLTRLTVKNRMSNNFVNHTLAAKKKGPDKNPPLL